MPRGHRKLVKPRTFVYARRMRVNPTDAEAVLWHCLRKRRLDGFRFRRQVVIFGFIVDFYCPEARLAIEVDGLYHANRQAYDRMRDARIRGGGFRLVRFQNSEVLDDCDSVLIKIRTLLQNPITVKLPT